MGYWLLRKQMKMINKHNIKRLLLAGLLCTAATVQAQNGFNIPYSQFGIGSTEQPYNLPMVTRMGGTAYTRAGYNYVNPFNPASYGAIQKESFVFDMGVNLQVSTLSDKNSSLKDADGNIAYLMVAMPVTKWWKLAGGLMPYSMVSYESVMHQTDATSGSVTTTYSGGDGQGYPSGVNEVFLGSAFNLLEGDGKRPDVQAGFNAYYLTGTIVRAISYDFPNNSTTYFLDKRRYKKTTVSNFLFDVGVQMRQPLGEKFTLGVGLVYKPHLTMPLNEEALVYTYHSTDETLVDTIFPARGQDNKFKSTMEQAQTFGIGLSIERNKQWQVAVDATFADWAGMKCTEGLENPVFGESPLRYGSWSRYALGLEKIGDMDASSYWGRMSWSLGVHSEQGALRLAIEGTEHRIDEWGAGMGVSMPMRKGKSLLTLSVGYSSLGSIDLLRRDTWTFGIAVSSCERWFAKRRYN